MSVLLLTLPFVLEAFWRRPDVGFNFTSEIPHHGCFGQNRVPRWTYPNMNRLPDMVNLEGYLGLQLGSAASLAHAVGIFRGLFPEGYT